MPSTLTSDWSTVVPVPAIFLKAVPSRLNVELFVTVVPVKPAAVEFNVPPFTVTLPEIIASLSKTPEVKITSLATLPLKSTVPVSDPELISVEPVPGTPAIPPIVNVLPDSELSFKVPAL